MSTSCYYLLDNIHFFTTFNLNVMFRKEFFKTADTFLFIFPLKQPFFTFKRTDSIGQHQQFHFFLTDNCKCAQTNVQSNVTRTSSSFEVSRFFIPFSWRYPFKNNLDIKFILFTNPLSHNPAISNIILKSLEFVRIVLITNDLK